MSRECPEPRKENRGGGGGGRGGFNSGGNRGGFNSGGNRGGFNSDGGGGFNSGSGDRNINYESAPNGGGSSMSITVRNSRNQNGDNQDDNGDKKTTFGGWRGGASNGNDAENSNGRSTFNNSTSRAGFRGKKYFIEHKNTGFLA